MWKTLPLALPEEGNISYNLSKWFVLKVIWSRSFFPLNITKNMFYVVSSSISHSNQNILFSSCMILRSHVIFCWQRFLFSKITRIYLLESKPTNYITHKASAFCINETRLWISCGCINYIKPYFFCKNIMPIPKLLPEDMKIAHTLSSSKNKTK